VRTGAPGDTQCRCNPAGVQLPASVMSTFEPALPKLAAARRLMWEVREVCADDEMSELLTEALEANADAQRRLRAIEREAREAA
jgi:hypothetical protein